VGNPTFEAWHRGQAACLPPHAKRDLRPSYSPSSLVRVKGCRREAEVVGKGESGVESIAGLCRSVVDPANQTACFGGVVRPSRISFDSVCREMFQSFQPDASTTTRCRTPHGKEHVTAFDFSLGCAARVLVAVLALLSIQPKCFVTIRSFV
jgi:hypothetical protein